MAGRKGTAAVQAEAESIQKLTKSEIAAVNQRVDEANAKTSAQIQSLQAQIKKLQKQINNLP